MTQLYFYQRADKSIFYTELNETEHVPSSFVYIGTCSADSYQEVYRTELAKIKPTQLAVKKLERLLDLVMEKLTDAEIDGKSTKILEAKQKDLLAKYAAMQDKLNKLMETIEEKAVSACLPKAKRNKLPPPNLNMVVHKDQTQVGVPAFLQNWVASHK